MKILTSTKLLACWSLLLAMTADMASAEQNVRVINARFKNLEEEKAGDAEDFSVPIISVGTKGPKSVESDEPATYEIKVRNISSKKDASVNVLIRYSQDCGFINANPAPQYQTDGELEYQIENLQRLTDQDFTLTLLPPQSGEINVDVVCKLEADNKLATIVKRPSLRFDVNAPPFGRVGEKIPFEFTVFNNGDGLVRDARVYAEFPPELTIDEETSERLSEPFTIKAGGQQQLKANLIGIVAGIHDVRFRLLMGNVPSQTLQTTLCVTQPTTDLHFVGPAQQAVGEPGDYSLIIENNNQNAIENAELDLEIPDSIKIEKVSRYADFFRDEYGRMHLRWPVLKIEPGKRMVIRLRAVGLRQQKSDCKIEVYYDNNTKKISNYSIDVIDGGGEFAPFESAEAVDLTDTRTGELDSEVPRAKLNR